jgi:8-oxo-(d)GTP phosphatase
MGNILGKVIQNPSAKTAILAAGAVLWRKEPFVSDIAIIHKTRYGDEWCLPKGKVKEGETLEQAALREVKEETRCLAKIVRYSCFRILI